MKIFYTLNAVRDLERLHNFIAEKNPKAAAEISQKLVDAVQRLIDFPMLGRKAKEEEDASLRDLITGNYIIRYFILQSEIHILRIWHGREDVTLCTDNKLREKIT